LVGLTSNASENTSASIHHVIREEESRWLHVLHVPRDDEWHMSGGVLREEEQKE
jgi:hypothetical protein